MYLTLFKREIALHTAGLGEWLATPALYLLAVCFYMMGQPHGLEADESGAVAALWLCALLAFGLTQYRIWEDDARDGTLEQWMLLAVPLEGIVVVKLVAHWLISGLPLIIMTPVMEVFLGVQSSAALPLCVGTLALTALGSVAGAVGIRFASRQVLNLLLVFPLSVPLLIFGAAASMSQDTEGMSLLLAYALTVFPLATAISALLLRMSSRA